MPKKFKPKPDKVLSFLERNQLTLALETGIVYDFPELYNEHSIRCYQQRSLDYQDGDTVSSIRYRVFVNGRLYGYLPGYYSTVEQAVAFAMASVDVALGDSRPFDEIYAEHLQPVTDYILKSIQ
jgi:hypothetical protein